MIVEINLLPGTQRGKQKSKFDVSELVTKFRETFKDTYLLAAIGSGVFAVAAIATLFFFQSTRANELAERETVAVTDSAKFAKVLAARLGAQSNRDSIYQQLAIIRSIDNMRFTWAHILEEVNIALPAYTWLASITQTSPLTTTAKEDSVVTDGKDKQSANARLRTVESRRARSDSLFYGNASPTHFKIVGQTVDIQALTLFMKNLEASPFIKNVQLARSDLVVSDKKEVTEFQLNAESEIPPNEFIQTIPLTIAVKE